jgi:hypothetical protein
MRYIKSFVLLIAMQLFSNGQQDAESPTEQYDKKTTENSKAEIVADPEGTPYFPKGRESYYTPYYRAAGLPSFQSTKVAKNGVTFRAAVFPSFSKPLFLTYSRTEAGATIAVARLSGRCVLAEKPGRVELSGKVAMSDEAADRFEKLAKWDVVRNPFKEVDDRLLSLYEGLDGVRWVLEVVDAKGYTMVDVWSPDSFEYTEKLARESYDKEIRKAPSKYGLPDKFKEIDLPDLDVSVLTSFLEDLLKIAGAGIPETRGDEIPSHAGPE